MPTPKKIIFKDTPNNGNALHPETETDCVLISNYSEEGKILVTNANGTISESTYTLPDNNQNKLENKTFVTTQEDFDNLMDDIKNGETVDAVLGQGTFVAKEKLTLTSGNIKIVGSNTTIKGNNQTFTRADADTTYVSSTHYRCAVGNNPIPSYSLFLDSDGNIIPLSEFANGEAITTDLSYLAENGSALSGSSIVIDNWFAIPDTGIVELLENYNGGDDITPFGFVESEWSSDLFEMYSNKSAVTFGGNPYFRAVPTVKSTSYPDKGILRSNPNYIKNTLGNKYYLLNVPSDTGLFYSDEYVYIPLNIPYVEVVRNTSTNTFLRGQNQTDLNISLTGVNFSGFYQVIYLSENASNSNYSQCSIVNCTFKNTINDAIRIVLNNDNLEVAFYRKPIEIRGCKFFNTAQVDSSSLYIDARPYIDAYENPDVFFVNVSDIYINEHTDDYCHYKKDFNGIVYLNGNVSFTGSEIINNPRTNINVSHGHVVVDNCHVHNTDKFISLSRNQQLDAGLVYFARINEQTIPFNTRHLGVLSNSKIHGTRSLLMNLRGIYIDDGRGDVTCINNVVFNCSSYTLDSRDISAGTRNTNFYRWYDNNSEAFYTLYDGSADKSDVVVAVYDDTAFKQVATGNIVNGTLTFSYGGLVHTCTYASSTPQNPNPSSFNFSSIRNYITKNVFVGSVRLQGGDDVDNVIFMENNGIPRYEGNLELGDFTLNKYNLTETDTVTSLKYSIMSDSVSVDTTTYETIDKSMRAIVNRSYLDAVQATPWKMEMMVNDVMNADNNFTHRSAHFIEIPYGTLLSSDVIEIEFDSRYQPYHYKLGLSSTATNLSDTFVPRLNNLQASSGYIPSRRSWTCEMLTALMWSDSDNQICRIAVFVDGLCEHKNSQGGIFIVRCTKAINPTINIYRTSENNDTLEFSNSSGVLKGTVSPNDRILIKQVLCELPYYVMGNDGNPTNALASKYPISANTTDTSNYIKGGQQRQYRTVVVMDIDGNYYNGILTSNGLYNIEGETLQRPTVSQYDVIQYYDTDLKKMIMWNGVAWVNLDGTGLS